MSRLQFSVVGVLFVFAAVLLLTEAKKAEKVAKQPVPPPPPPVVLDPNFDYDRWRLYFVFANQSDWSAHDHELDQVCYLVTDKAAQDVYKKSRKQQGRYIASTSQQQPASQELSQQCTSPPFKLLGKWVNYDLSAKACCAQGPALRQPCFAMLRDSYVNQVCQLRQGEACCQMAGQERLQCLQHLVDDACYSVAAEFGERWYLLPGQSDDVADISCYEDEYFPEQNVQLYDDQNVTAELCAQEGQPAARKPQIAEQCCKSGAFIADQKVNETGQCAYLQCRHYAKLFAKAHAQCISYPKVCGFMFIKCCERQHHKLIYTSAAQNGTNATATQQDAQQAQPQPNGNAAQPVPLFNTQP